jgi:hypothetical protein
MESTDLFNQYLKLSPEGQNNFLHSLSMHLLLNLSNGKFLVVSKEEFVRLERCARLYHDAIRYIDLDPDLLA